MTCYYEKRELTSLYAEALGKPQSEGQPQIEAIRDEVSRMATDESEADRIWKLIVSSAQ